MIIHHPFHCYHFLLHTIVACVVSQCFTANSQGSEPECGQEPWARAKQRRPSRSPSSVPGALGFHLQCLQVLCWALLKLPTSSRTWERNKRVRNLRLSQERSYTNLRLKIFPRLSAIIALSLAILREKLQGNTMETPYSISIWRFPKMGGTMGVMGAPLNHPFEWHVPFRFKGYPHYGFQPLVAGREALALKAHKTGGIFFRGSNCSPRTVMRICCFYKPTLYIYIYNIIYIPE